MEQKQNPGSRQTGQGRVRRLKKEEVRSRLLEAAANVFSEKGFDAATLEEVAEAAGFSKGAVYSNFSGKDELFCDLMDKRVDERIALMGGAVAGVGIEERSRSGLQALERAVRLEPEWQILFIEYWLRAIRNPVLRKRFAERRRGVRSTIARLFEEQAAANGLEFPVDAERLAIAVLGLSNGVGMERIADPDAVPEGLFADLVSLVFQGTKPRAPGTKSRAPGTKSRAPGTKSRR